MKKSKIAFLRKGLSTAACAAAWIAISGINVWSAGDQKNWRMNVEPSGDFVIKLNPPDSDSAREIRRHVIYSHILSTLIQRELIYRAPQCPLLVIPDRFPNISIVFDRASAADTKIECLRMSAAITRMTDFEPENVAAAIQSVHEFYSDLDTWLTAKEARLKAAYLVRIILENIYTDSSLARSILSVNSSQDISIASSPEKFIQWLSVQRQRTDFEPVPSSAVLTPRQVDSASKKSPSQPVELLLPDDKFGGVLLYPFEWRSTADDYISGVKLCPESSGNLLANADRICTVYCVADIECWVATFVSRIAAPDDSENTKKQLEELKANLGDIKGAFMATFN
jgi:hypothetical protein